MDLVQWLISEGHVTADGVDIFRDFRPDTPENVVSLYEYDSMLPTKKGIKASVRYVQITVRNSSVDDAKNKCMAIFKSFEESDEAIMELASGRWVIMIPRQMPFKIGIDDNGLTTYGFNVAITTNTD